MLNAIRRMAVAVYLGIQAVRTQSSCAALLDASLDSSLICP
jgi:hypothetical protein